MDLQISSLANELSNSIETILNPSSSQNDRQIAHKICEDFKESSPYCVPVGLTLADKSYKPVVRHFGLQLLEHAIKFRWIQMKTEERENLKENALQFMATGTLGILEEEFHIKDAVARITVELAKREWPHLWPSLQEDLYKLCQMGETQTELVLKVYLRLCGRCRSVTDTSPPATTRNHAWPDRQHEGLVRNVRSVSPGSHNPCH